MTLPGGGSDLDERVRAGRRKAALAVSIVATLALLCCGGGVSSFFLGGLGDEDNLISASFGCGGEVLPDGVELPAFANYSPRQISHALTIVRIGDERRLEARAWIIAVAVALVETRLKNYANDNPEYPAVRRISMALPHDAVGNDHDSVGLFQQRPSSGWGPVGRLMDPEFATRQFLSALEEVPGWQQMRLTDAAQAVQVSAYPEHYAKHEWRASKVVAAIVPAGK